MFGRKVDVTVFNVFGDGVKLVDSSQGKNSLVCKGRIERYSGTKQPSLKLSIFNLGSSLRGEIVVNNYKYIRVEYGYEDDGSAGSQIFEGKIVKIQFKRKDEITTETVLYAWENGDMFEYGFCSQSFEDGVNYYEIASAVAKNGKVNVTADLSEKLKGYKAQGAVTYYGDKATIFNDIANKTNSRLVIKGNTISIQPADAKTEVIILTQTRKSDKKVISSSGLVGYPTLTDDGLEFQCLINSSMGIYSLVQIDNSIISINQDGIVPSVNLVGAQLDVDGLYRVIRMTIDFANDSSDSLITAKAVSRLVYDDLKTE